MRLPLNEESTNSTDPWCFPIAPERGPEAEALARFLTLRAEAWELWMREVEPINEPES